MNYKKNAKNVTKYICEKCDFKSSNKTDYNRHLLTAKHKYYCENCDYRCKNKFNFNKHLLTEKHKYLKNNHEKDEKLCKCICGKVYKHRQSLYTHQKTCDVLLSSTPITGKISEELITKFMYTQLEETKELKNILLEQNKELRKIITEMIVK